MPRTATGKSDKRYPRRKSEPNRAQDEIARWLGQRLRAALNKTAEAETCRGTRVPDRALIN